MGCPCQQRGSQRFVVTPPEPRQPGATSRQNLAYTPPAAPIRRSGSVFWDGKTTRVA